LPVFLLYPALVRSSHEDRFGIPICITKLTNIATQVPVAMYLSERDKVLGRSE